MELYLPSQKAGTYHLIARYTKGPNYGTFEISLNGTDLGQPIDLYDPELKAIDPIDLGVVTLPDGKPILKVTATGKNTASKDFTFGLDYLNLMPAP